MDDDPIRRRAEQIRAEQADAARQEGALATQLHSERAAFVQRFLDTLTEKTSHAMECVEVIGKANAALARFSFVREGKPGTVNVFEFGIDRVESGSESRRFSYFLEPTSAAFGIANPDTGTAGALRNSPEEMVRNYAVAIAFEAMARVVASGGLLGRPAEIEALLDEHEERARRRRNEQRREQSRRFWGGCLTGVLWLFGGAFAIGLLGSLLRACDGGG